MRRLNDAPLVERRYCGQIQGQGQGLPPQNPKTPTPLSITAYQSQPLVHGSRPQSCGEALAAAKAHKLS